MINRRAALALIGSAALPLCAARSADDPVLAAIAQGLGGRLGVFALDTGSGRSIGHDADARYAMASTFKLPLAAAVLYAVFQGRLAAGAMVPFTEADLLDYAPTVKAAGVPGALPIEALIAGAVVLSDNSAANLLLARIGGPTGLTRFARRAGDGTTRFDRTEPTLNANLPGDARDTTTPRAMVGLLRTLLLGPLLPADARGRLIGWMVECRTGLARLRGGLPEGWSAGDKTGTGLRGAANDIAILWPPGRPPILVACYVDAAAATAEARDAAHRAVARRIVAVFG